MGMQLDGSHPGDQLPWSYLSPILAAMGKITFLVPLERFATPPFSPLQRDQSQYFQLVSS